MRYVFDTNAIVSAILFDNSKPDRALRYASRPRFLLHLRSVLVDTEQVNLYKILHQKYGAFFHSSLLRFALLAIALSI
ncbi:MAG: PIN domain-containing protein [Microcoleus sp. CAN_BIN18]|nr:PIN domain-containing protein [Microcoleus sp. CAN_BIN18]